MFIVDGQDLLYTRSPGKYDRDLCRQDLFDSSVLRRAIHPRRERLTGNSLVEMVHYNASDKSPSQHPRLGKRDDEHSTNTEGGVLHRDAPTSRAGRRAIWRPEQNSVSWMRDVMRRFSEAGDLKMSFCAITCSIAKACMLLDQRRNFAGWDVSAEVLSAAEPYHVLTSAFQVLKPMSDLNESSEVEAAAKIFKDEVSALLARKEASVREIPPGLDATQAMPCRIPRFLLPLYAKCSLYNMCQNIAFSL